MSFFELEKLKIEKCSEYSLLRESSNLNISAITLNPNDKNSDNNHRNVSQIFKSGKSFDNMSSQNIKTIKKRVSAMNNENKTNKENILEESSFRKQSKQVIIVDKNENNLSHIPYSRQNILKSSIKKINSGNASPLLVYSQFPSIQNNISIKRSVSKNLVPYSNRDSYKRSNLNYFTRKGKMDSPNQQSAYLAAIESLKKKYKI